jgi:hypothetical protein
VAYIKTDVGDYGWTVEMAIPWTTLRFDPTREDQVWGADFMLEDVLQTRTGTVGLEVSFLDGGALNLLYNDRFERLDERFEVLPEAVVPAGSYSFREATVGYSSNKACPVSGTVEVSKGGYFDGSRSSIGGDIRFEANYHLAFELCASRNKFAVQNSPYTADVYGAQAKYAYNTSLFFSAYVQ